MGLRISTNVPSLNAQRNLSISTKQYTDSLEKLSSGSRINKGSDDAAGLAISEKLKAQIRSVRQARRNADDGISMIQTAEGGLNEISNILIRLRELSMQSASDTIGNEERKFVDLEFQQLKSEIQRISEVTNYNGTKLLDGSVGLLDFQVGTFNDPFQDRITYDGQNANAGLQNLGIIEESSATKEQAQLALSKIDKSITGINAIRADLGSIQNRLQSTVSNLMVADENLSAAKSRIRDVDVASETAELTRNNILQQAGIAVLSQANQQPAAALKLLREAS